VFSVPGFEVRSLVFQASRLGCRYDEGAPLREGCDLVNALSRLVLRYVDLPSKIVWLNRYNLVGTEGRMAYIRQSRPSDLAVVFRAVLTCQTTSCSLIRAF